MGNPNPFTSVRSDTTICPVPSPFVHLLQREQYRTGLSQARFARDVLGISPSTWKLVQEGKRHPGKVVIKGAFRAFPDLHADLASALLMPAFPNFKPRPVQPGVGRPPGSRTKERRLEVVG